LNNAMLTCIHAYSLRCLLQEQLLLEHCSQQCQAAGVAAAANSNNNTFGQLLRIFKMKMLPNRQNLISTNDPQATSVMLSWVMLSPFVSLELLDRQQGVALGTTVPKLNQLLTALAGGFVIIGATIALGLHLKAVFLVWTTSLWAKSCVAILAIAAVGVLMEVVAGLNRRLRVAAAPRNPPPAIERRNNHPHPIKATVRPTVKLDDSRGFVQHSTFDCLDVRADVYHYSSDRRIMWGPHTCRHTDITATNEEREVAD
ncbi:hypothetical protein Vretimale_2482, partial [Volvox reticuliferus]